MTIKELRAAAIIQCKDSGMATSWIQMANKAALELFLINGTAPVINHSNVVSEAEEAAPECEEEEAEEAPETKAAPVKLIGITGTINLSVDIASLESLKAAHDAIVNLLRLHGIEPVNAETEEEAEEEIDYTPEWIHAERAEAFEREMDIKESMKAEPETEKGGYYEQ